MSDQLFLLRDAIDQRMASLTGHWPALWDDDARAICAVSAMENDLEALVNLTRDARILLSPAGIADAAKAALLRGEYPQAEERMHPGGASERVGELEEALRVALDRLVQVEQYKCCAIHALPGCCAAIELGEKVLATPARKPKPAPAGEFATVAALRRLTLEEKCPGSEGRPYPLVVEVLV